VRRLLVLAILLSLLAPATAAAFPATNPADALVDLPIEPSHYDKATRCASKVRPGMLELQHWLEANVRAPLLAPVRAPEHAAHEASLHAENRAIDWHLDASDKTDRRAARKLIELVLAADSVGNAQALARRMGVEELIWDCEYWGAGMSDFIPYQVCYSKKGKLKKDVNVTVAHRDHVHIGMTKAGAAAKTSFWRHAA